MGKRFVSRAGGTRGRRQRAVARIEACESRLLLSAYNPFAGGGALYANLNYAIYRPSDATIHIDTNRDGQADKYFRYGNPGDVITTGDLNGDGLSDLAVFRNGTWFLDRNRDGIAETWLNFGQTGDVPLIGDVNGDGQGDLIVFRNGTWFVDTNMDGTTDMQSTFGQAGDKPVVGDFNGDGRLDRAVYRPSTGAWLIDYSFSGTVGATCVFGGDPADVPFAADFNGDKFSDLGIFRNGTIFYDTARTGSATGMIHYGTAGDVPIFGSYALGAMTHTLTPGFAVFTGSIGQVAIDATGGGTPTQAIRFGQAGDQMVAGDFDGNTATDLAVFRNGTWLIDTNHDGTPNRSVVFGAPGDVAVAGDVNNDGVADLVAFRNGTWFVDTNQDGRAESWSIFGQAGDVPLLGDFNGDGITDRAVYRPSTGVWYIDYGFKGAADVMYNFGGAAQDKPVAFDFNGDGKTDLAIFRDGMWFVDLAHTGTTTAYYRLGGAGDIPLAGYFDTTHSKFVAPGGTGNGSESAPFGSISAATAAAAAGDIIRIAPGTYAEQVALINRQDVTYVGASRWTTAVTPTNGDSFTLNGSTGIYLRNLTLNSQSTAANTGRGVIAVNSSVFGEGIRTNGVRYEGIYAVSNNGGTTLIDIRDSSLDGSKCSAGLFVQTGAIVRLNNVTANGEGTDTVTMTQQWGRGFVFSGSGNHAFLQHVSGSYNPEHGLIADGTTDLLLLNSNFSNNPNKNGAILLRDITFTIDGCDFSNNGSIRNIMQGYNGLEVFVTGGEKGIISNSTFRSNTAYGLFLQSGPDFTVRGCTFDNNLCQIYVNGTAGFVINGITVPGITNVTLWGNTFTAPAGSSLTGINVHGGGATATIGGYAAWQKNTFSGFPNYNTIFIDRDPNNLASIGKAYAGPRSVNNYIGILNPIGGYAGALTIPA